MKRTLFVFAILCISCISNSQSYTMYALETPSGTLSSTAYEINNSGVAVGSCNIVGNSDRAVKWSASTTPTVTVLSGLDTYGINRAYSINDSGTICGVSMNSSGVYQAVTWSSTGTISNITPSGEYSGRGQKINNRGEVLGFASTSSGDSYVFTWNGTTSSSLTPGTYTGDNPIAFNEAGQALTANYNDWLKFYLYTNGTRNTFWSASPWNSPRVLDMNQAGQILFITRSGYGDPDELKLWNPDGRNATTGASQDITPSGLATGYAISNTAINAFGDIVTSSVPSGQTNCHAMVRLRSSTGAATWLDLNSLVTNLDGWVLNYAVDINDKGQILCWGTKIVSGQTRQISFRLDPGFTISR
ncbi:MAG: hypothetical protein JST12_18600 [Armatimonadetes bacterium]|nr:hypothetical protein [Armatimonadota bacterium]